MTSNAKLWLAAVFGLALSFPAVSLANDHPEPGQIGPEVHKWKCISEGIKPDPVGPHTFEAYGPSRREARSAALAMCKSQGYQHCLAQPSGCSRT